MRSTKHTKGRNATKPNQSKGDPHKGTAKCHWCETRFDLPSVGFRWADVDQEAWADFLKKNKKLYCPRTSCVRARQENSVVEPAVVPVWS